MTVQYFRLTHADNTKKSAGLPHKCGSPAVKNLKGLFCVKEALFCLLIEEVNLSHVY